MEKDRLVSRGYSRHYYSLNSQTTHSCSLNASVSSGACAGGSGLGEVCEDDGGVNGLRYTERALREPRLECEQRRRFEWAAKSATRTSL